MEQKYTASLGTISIVITVLLASMGLLTPMLLVPTGEQEPDLIWVCAFFPGLIFIILTISYLYMPRWYIVSPKGILTGRRISDVLIPIEAIDNARTVTEEEMGFAIRLFGNGGVFGFTGYYFSRKMGRMRLYATRKSHYVLIIGNENKKIIVTPDNPEAMVDAINTLLKKSVG